MRARDLPKLVLFACVIRPFVRVFIRLKTHNLENIPHQGPAVIVANHNSHLDTLVLMQLFPLKLLPKVRPLAAADHFFKGTVQKCLAETCLGAVPVMRKLTEKRDPLQEAKAALANGDILIMFPEGTRGKPGKLGPIRKGIAYLACSTQRVPVVPVYLRGLEPSISNLQKFRTVACDAKINVAIRCEGEQAVFMKEIERNLSAPEKREKAFP